MSDDGESVRDEADERREERTETVEEILAEVREDLGDQTYPVTSEQLAAMYADTSSDLPNETESLGSALDRIDNSFEDEQAAYEALVTAVEEGQHLDRRSDAKGPEPPYTEGDRAGTEPSVEETSVDERYESGIDASRERASEAQAAAAEDEDDRDRDESEDESAADADGPSER